MTKSTITREQLIKKAQEQIEFCRHTKITGEGRAHVNQCAALFEIALAAMDGEPVAWGNGCDKTVPAALRYLAENERPFGGESRFNAAHLYQLAREIELMAEAPLYRHAQPAKTVQPVMFIDGDISSEDADKLAKVIREFNEEDERPLAKMARIIRENPHPTNECDMPKGQPAPDYFASLVAAARVRADKAIRKFPQPNYVLSKVAEESGEVIKAVIHYTEGREEWSNVEAEIIDNLAMLIRLVKEGDQVIGFTPPVSCRAATLNGGKP